jgi:predicted RNA-binding protein with PIN domain
MQQIFVDAYNLLYSDEELTELADQNLKRARQRLIKRIVAYAGSKKVIVTLIFDGSQELIQEAEMASGRVKIIYSSPPASADDLMVSELDRLRPPPGTTVVTSDNQLAALCRMRAVKVVASDKFWLRLQKTAGFDQKRGEKPGAVSGRELEEWLRIFSQGTKGKRS